MYTITIIGDGDHKDAEAVAQSAVSALKGSGHGLTRATVSEDRGGMVDLIAPPPDAPVA